MLIVFIFNETVTTWIYTYCHTLSLHDALPSFGFIIPFIDPGDAKAAQCGPVLAGATAAAQRTSKGKPRDDVGKGTTAKSEDGKQSADGQKKQRKKFLGIF